MSEQNEVVYAEDPDQAELDAFSTTDPTMTVWGVAQFLFWVLLFVTIIVLFGYGVHREVLQQKALNDRWDGKPLPPGLHVRIGTKDDWSSGTVVQVQSNGLYLVRTSARGVMSEVHCSRGEMTVIP